MKNLPLAQSSSMKGKVCLITGATGGLGKAAALQLVALGATVVLVGRDPLRLQTALAEIQRQTGAPQGVGFCADLSSQAEITRLAKQVQGAFSRLDVLINNVGAFFWDYQATPDGIERTWALNYLNHFLLTRCLQDLLVHTAQTSGEARVLELTSVIYTWAGQKFHPHPAARGYNGVFAYAQAKRAAIVFAIELARRLEKQRVAVNAVSPGLVATQIALNNPWAVRGVMRCLQKVAHSVDAGAEPLVFLASAPECSGVTGQHFERFRRLLPDPVLTAPRLGQTLWRLSEGQLPA